MAQDWKEKSVQSIKDPSARKKAFYSLQRQDAEETGNVDTLKSINKKTKLYKNPDDFKPQAQHDDWKKAAYASLAFLPMGRVAKGIGAAAKGVGSAIKLGRATKLGEVTQDLGVARPIAKALSGGIKAAKNETGSAMKALNKGKAALTSNTGKKVLTAAKAASNTNKATNVAKYAEEEAMPKSKAPRAPRANPRPRGVKASETGTKKRMDRAKK